MKLLDIEKQVIRQYLITKRASKNVVDEFFLSVNVKNREFSGVGFMSYLCTESAPVIDVELNSFNWGKVGIKINNSIDTGYLLYIEGGYITAIEGYTYDEEWPKSVTKIELYEL